MEGPSLARPRLVVVPSDDPAFARIAGRLAAEATVDSAAALESRIQKVFPRAVVRARELAGESPAYYVYRDGGWRPEIHASWWEPSGMPRIGLTLDGWLVQADAIALGLLGIEAAELGSRHVTDFVPAGTLAEVEAILDVIRGGAELTATLRLRPSSGYVIAVDVHAERQGDRIEAVLRLAGDVDAGDAPPDHAAPTLRCFPETDAAFRAYAERSLARMPEPTPEGLAIRLRRLYPRADVVPGKDGWRALRDPDTEGGSEPGWWEAAGLPQVLYDARGLILEANAEADALLGRPLAGHHWQEFVTPGSDDQVGAMLAILEALGRAESRFRMPRADGALMEFDSYTEVDGDRFRTVIRPRG